MYIMDRKKSLCIEGLNINVLYNLLSQYALNKEYMKNVFENAKEKSNVGIDVLFVSKSDIMLSNGKTIRCIKNYYEKIDSDININQDLISKRKITSQFECNCIKEHYGITKSKLFDCDNCHSEACTMYKNKILTIK